MPFRLTRARLAFGGISAVRQGRFHNGQIRHKGPTLGALRPEAIQAQTLSARSGGEARQLLVTLVPAPQRPEDHRIPPDPGSQLFLQNDFVTTPSPNPSKVIISPRFKQVS